MNVLISLGAVAGLFLLGLGAAAIGLQVVLGVVFPYLALALFAGGLIWKVAGWARVPVPFRVPTTCGQQKSLPWIRRQGLENPSSGWEAAGRMALEVLCFRSLLRNTKAELREGGKLTYGTSIWLWLGGLAFHAAMLTVVLRHLRFFTEPVPWCVMFLQDADGFLEIGVPVFYATTGIYLASLGYLLARRLADPMLRYISLAADYFPLLLLLGIGLSGLWMRHFTKTDLAGIKALTVGLVRLSPSVPDSVSPLFYAHLFLVCVLLAYLPFSKLAHMAGVFLSPTRNLANTNRRVRHVNPWDHPVKVHSYAEYEEEFRDKMKAAGLPVEKESS